MRCVFFVDQLELKGSGFVDTGNHLTDEKTALPIMMVPKEMLCLGRLKNS